MQRMIQSTKIMPLVFCAMLFLLFSTPVFGQELLDRVLVSIEGEPITQSEVTRFARDRGKAIAKFSKDSVEAQAILQEVVVQRLLDKEAESLNISVSNEEISAYLSEIRRQNGMDEQSFKEVLSQRGITWESYLSQVRTDIIKNRVVSARVRSKVNVVDEDIQRYLDSQPALRPAIGTRRVFEIPLGFVESSASQKLNSLKQRINEQEEFDALPLLELGAKDLGYVSTADLRQEIAATLASTEDHSFSEVIELDMQQTAYFVVGTISEKTPIDPVLSKEISAKVYEKKFSERLQEFIDVELPARYHVEQL